MLQFLINRKLLKPQNSFSTRWNPRKNICPPNIFNLKNLIVSFKSAKLKLEK
ncbi:unnamed protein product, partial [Nesidiocoris tenuis]